MEEEINFNYINAEVSKIIPYDEINKKNAIYILEIYELKNKNNKWTKKYTLTEIENFRNYIIKYVPAVINLPFPYISLFSYLPFFGWKYDERNWDILLENKFILDNFFNTICQNKKIYILSEFNTFFYESTRFSIFNNF